MGDLISQKAFIIEALKHYHDASFTPRVYEHSIFGQAAMLLEMDTVEVVRCKDCKRWMKDVAGCTDFVGRCAYANYMIGANGYCLYGERKEKGDGRKMPTPPKQD